MLKIIAERLRAELAGVAELEVFEVLAEGEDGRQDLTADVPLVVLETQSVSPAVSGAPAHPSRKVQAELVLSVAVAHPAAEAGACARARALLGGVLEVVLGKLRACEVVAPSGRVVYSVAGWCEGWSGLAADGKLYEWRLPFVWVVVE